MSNRTATPARAAFKAAFALTRTNRHNVHFANQIFGFGRDGEIFVGANGILLIGRRGVYNDAALYSNMILGNARGYAPSRRHFIERARETGPISLP